jgi:hypothetical protein
MVNHYNAGTNAEAWVGRCISAISNVMAAVEEPHEIIVICVPIPFGASRD